MRDRKLKKPSINAASLSLLSLTSNETASEYLLLFIRYLFLPALFSIPSICVCSMILVVSCRLLLIS